MLEGRGGSMRTMIITALASGALIAALVAQGSEKKISMKDVPAAVQQAIKEQSKGATLRGVAKEVEHGKTLYEAELNVKGHSKDGTFDAQGQVVNVTQQHLIADIT